MAQTPDRAAPGSVTIGFLPQLASGFGGFQDMVWRNMVVAARRRGVNALLFAGGSVDGAPYNPFEKNLNLVYDLIDRRYVDGLLVNYTIGNYVTGERLRDFCRAYGVPVVSIIGAIDGFPDVHVENKTSLRDMVLHLAREHGHRNIAFIRGTAGNPDAEERFSVYRESLAECGLAYDGDLVFQGQFDEESGIKAVRRFLGLKGKNVTAIMASNDAMAFGAINGLRAEGKRVPWDMAVTGFDDTEEAAAYTPALTTVRQPFDEICERALDVLCRMIDGGESPGSVAIPARLVVRQSCGCDSSILLETEVQETVREAAGLEAESGEWTHVVGTISEEMLETGAEKNREVLREAVERFLDDVRGDRPGSFLEFLRALLLEKVIRNEEITAWNHALFVLRKWSAILFTPGKEAGDAEDKIIQACVLVGESSRQSQAYQKILLDKRFKELSAVGQDLITTFDFDRLRERIKYQLIRLRILSCFISVFKDYQASTINGVSTLFLAYRQRQGGGEDTLKLNHTAHTLPDKQFLPHDRRYTFAVHPLFFKEYKLGYAMFELGPEEGMVYDTLQVQLSSSLMGSELIRQREKTEAEEKERSDRIQGLVRPMLDAISRVTTTARDKISMIGDLVSVTKENSDKLDSTNTAIQSMGVKLVKMGDVVDIINDISARVNILAINTSIESAHAGEFGRGFAVIASEIRKLADSIQSNVSVISNYLKEIQPSIEISRKAGNSSQEAFRRLENDVAEVSQALQVISGSMEELSSGSTRIISVLNEDGGRE